MLSAATARYAVAAEGGHGYRSRFAAPQDRRAGEHPGSGLGAVARGQRIELRNQPTGEGEAVVFTGCASATAQGYPMWDWAGPYTEIVDRGAFAASLARADLDVPLVIEHVTGRRLARTTVPAGELGHLSLVETVDGLMCEALLDPADPDVAYIAPKLRSGLIDEMSFRFVIVRGQWSPDWTEYHIQEVDIHRGDVAICAYGANPFTTAQVA